MWLAMGPQQSAPLLGSAPSSPTLFIKPWSSGWGKTVETRSASNKADDRHLAMGCDLVPQLPTNRHDASGLGAAGFPDAIGDRRWCVAVAMGLIFPAALTLDLEAV